MQVSAGRKPIVSVAPALVPSPVPTRRTTAGRRAADDAVLAADPSWRVLRTHRRCAPEHAGQVRRLCRSDRSVLPRWHQDDRGPADAHRGVHVSAPDGAYSRVEVWRSREHWLTWVVPAAIGVHREILKRHHVDPDTFRAWALVKSGYADTRTGRRCVVRPDTLASVMGVCERTVQRCTAAAREMGLEVVVLAGRMLTFSECARARRAGSRQRGLSTEVALTIPQASRGLVDRVTPTRGKRLPPQTSPSPGVPDGLTAEQRGAASPRHYHQGRRARGRPPGWSLAVELVRSVPWLAGEGPSRLAPTLTRFVTCERPWQAADVAAAIAGHTARVGAGPIRADTIRTRPAALLAAILRQLDPDIDHPGLGEDGFAMTPAADATSTAPAPQPCGAPGCDHGWLTATRPDGRPGLAPCPTCPPGVRSWQPLPGANDDVAAGAADWDPLDPPF